MNHTLNEPSQSTASNVPNPQVGMVLDTAREQDRQYRAARAERAQGCVVRAYRLFWHGLRAVYTSFGLGFVWMILLALAGRGGAEPTALLYRLGELLAVAFILSIVCTLLGGFACLSGLWMSRDQAIEIGDPERFDRGAFD